MSDTIQSSAGEDTVVLPASYAQQRVWFLDRLEPASGAYNVPAASRMRGPLEVDALETAINRLIERHETLRTVFAETDGVPHQVVFQDWPLTLEVTDLRGVPNAEARAHELVNEAASEPFDLSSDQLLRVALIKLGDEDHILVLTLHHIISDAWSLGVLNRELSAFYREAVEGVAADLPELEIQYGDFAAWQQEWMESGGLDEQLSYWTEHLAGIPGVLELPTDRPRPTEQSFNGATIRRMFEPRLLEQLKTFCEREGVTLFMALMAAFMALVSRYSGQEDFAVATPVANRSRMELEGLIGLFVNTLVMRADVSGEPTFRELLERVRETALGAFSNQDLPFEKLVQELSPRRDRSRAPIAQVLFAPVAAAGGSGGLVGLERERVNTDRGTAKFDISLIAGEVPEGLRVSIEYCTDLFEERTIEQMIEHYRLLLEAALANPDLPVDELPMLGDAERRELETAVPQYPVACMHERFEQCVAARPDAIALTHDGVSITYDELNRRANRLAHHLRALGAGPETMVALFLQPSPEMIAAVLGVLKSGAAYVPLDPEYPSERIGFVLQDTGARLVVTQEPMLERLPAHDASAICLDRDAPVLGELSEANPAPLAMPENLAYVIYTSGSTGLPKGVQVEHRHVARLFSATDAWYGFDRTDTWSLLHSYAFDFSVWEIWGALAYGGRLVISPSRTTRSPRALAALIADEGVTVMNATPSLFVAVQQELLAIADRLALRHVVFGGEALQPASLQPWFDHFGDRGPTLVNMYGITETTVHVTYRPLEAADCVRERSPIGVPIPDLTLHILDPKGAPVPAGVEGELYVGGAGVARGYLGRPELNAERFVANPFGPGRLYRTGDVARRLFDGELDFRGRIDDQVKIRGFRIELGEVQAALLAHPDVREALVMARDYGGDRRLVAYVISDHRPPSAAELRGHLQRTLPDYMIPAAFVTLDSFPLTTNGKTDRKALPPPDDLALASAEYVPPETELELSLAQIWQELLRVERVGLHDDFFTLGGHSLLATKLTSRVREHIGIDVPLNAIFSSPTLGDFSQTVEGCRGSEPLGLTQPPVRPLPREPRRIGSGGDDEDVYEFPASFAQQRLWFLDRFEPDSSAYNVPLVLRLRGQLNVDALRVAFDALIARHEALRTTFALIDGVPRQLVRPPQPLALHLTDLRGSADAEERARAVIDEECHRTFDLETGPLLRAGLLRLRDDEHILVVSMHHIVVDAWSIGVINRELSELYAAALENRAANLPELPLQYGDYAVWQDEWTRSGGLDEELSYWKHQLAGAPALLELPTDHPRPLKQSFRGAMARATVPAELLERVKAVGEREGTTLFMTLLSVFAALLSRYSGQDDVVVASPIANRDRLELEGIVGFFVNTLALRVRFDEDPSLRELLAQVRQTVLGAFSNQHVQFEKLVEELNPERHLSHAPIAQVLFVLGDGVGEGSLELPGVQRERVGLVRGSAKFDLSLFASDRPEGLHLGIEYCSDLFEPETMDRMLAHFQMLLEAIAFDPDESVSTLQLLTDGERELMREWNATGETAPSAQCVHDLVAHQVALTPDAVAVSFGRERLSYAELDARANRLARHLLELGVGSDVPVAVCLERSLDLAVAVLAVLKAGGAYSPVDPAYPAERIGYMLADSNAPVLLTQRHLLQRLPPHRARTVCLDTDWQQVEEREATPPTVETTPDNLAYVIYTSGSTGRPKGVAMPHRPLVNLLAWQMENFSGPSAARTLQFAALSFDVAFQELFTTWCTGGTLVFIDEDSRRDPEKLLTVLREQEVERLFLPFVALQNLCEAAEYLRMSIPTLREVITAGEQLKVTDALHAFFTRHPGCALINQYGPTESHVATAFPLPGGADAWPALPPIGRPITGAKIHLLDDNRQPVPIGIPGELYIGGISLARGYLGRPELTAERFTLDPFETPPARMYRTGDLARYLPDGNIAYLGRADHQVKIRGFRVEPGEIEGILREHPTIREALVIAREDPRGDRRLVAYVIGDERTPTKTELREFLRRSLPEYMVPAAFVQLDAFPLSPNGKVDREALPAPDDEAHEVGQYAPPTNDLERTLVEIWQELLGVPRIGIHDNFFDLGGHSLLAVRLFSEIDRLLDVRLPLVAIFRTGTIHGLAYELRQGGHDVDQPTVLKLRTEGDGPVIFCIGGVHVYQELADELSPAFRSFGVFLPSEQELFEKESGTAHSQQLSVPEIGSQYVRLIRERQPDGPYIIFGLCFGGVVAYEVACQLVDAGEEVELLALFDSVLAEAVKNNPRLWLRRRARRLRRRLSAAVPERVNRLRGKVPLTPTERIALARHRIYAAATKGYQPRPYSGPALLVRASEIVQSYRQNLTDDTNGWGRYMERLEVHDSPGDHSTHLRRPNVVGLARELRERLEAIRDAKVRP